MATVNEKSRAKRSFGWVQNPSDFHTLKYITGIFDKGSVYRNDLMDYRLPMISLNGCISEGNYNKFRDLLRDGDAESISYSVLKGSGSGKGSRAQAKCSGIVQACIDGQKSYEYTGLDGAPCTLRKLYSDDWTADGYLRWAISLGLLEYSYSDDTCRLSETGRRFVRTADGSEEENVMLTRALMSYPPVMRILSLLADGKHLTKFEIGSQLGFKAELGFTSISQDYFIALWNETDSVAEKNKVRANVEGDSDKYARMICSWMAKMGWVKSARENREGVFNGAKYTMELQAHFITPKGLREYRKACGSSSNPRVPKIVMFEMLATKAPNAGYLRFRRAKLIEALSSPRTAAELAGFFDGIGSPELPQTILDDIEGLRRIGLDISVDSTGRYRLKDKVVGLHLPAKAEEREDITAIKERLRESLTNLSHDYLILIDLAYSDAATKSKKNIDARNFEIYTADLLIKEMEFEGRLLGGADKPDIVVWKDGFGVIVDSKSYKDGFSIGRSNEDEMCRYIDQAQRMTDGFPSNNWWKCLQENDVTDLHYLFVTSFLKGSFVKNLESIHQRSGITGGAVAIANLLTFAEQVKRGTTTVTTLPAHLHNSEATFM